MKVLLTTSPIVMGAVIGSVKREVAKVAIRADSDVNHFLDFFRYLKGLHQDLQIYLENTSCKNDTIDRLIDIGAEDLKFNIYPARVIEDLAIGKGVELVIGIDHLSPDGRCVYVPITKLGAEAMECLHIR